MRPRIRQSSIVSGATRTLVALRRALPAIGLSLLAGLASIAGCANDAPTRPPDPGPEPVPTGVPASFAIASGNGQEGAVTTTLGAPLVVKVTDATGVAVPNVPVTWTVGQYDGSLDRPTVATDSAGEARVQWTLGEDGGRRTVSASVVGLAAVAFTARAEADTIAPVLTGLAVSPATVSVETASAPVQYLVTLADSGAGVREVRLQFGPVNRPEIFLCRSTTLHEGTPQRGTWRCEGVVGRHAREGTYAVSQVLIVDRAFNSRIYALPALEAAGLRSPFTVASATPDATAPVLTSLQITPGTVDVTEAHQAVTFTVAVSDAGGSGINDVFLNLRLPGDTSSIFRPNPGRLGEECLNMTRSGGTTAVGTWTCTITIPRSAPAGQWEIWNVSVGDSAANRRGYSTALLQGAGHPAALTVVSGAPDVTPPRMTGFTVSPATVDVSTADQRIDFRVIAEDAIGIAEVSVWLGIGGPSHRARCTQQTPVEGTATSGTYQCSRRFTQYDPAGEWPILEVVTVDVVGNERRYTPAELQAAGMPTFVTVTR